MLTLSVAHITDGFFAALSPLGGDPERNVDPPTPTTLSGALPLVAAAPPAGSGPASSLASPRVPGDGAAPTGHGDGTSTNLTPRRPAGERMEQRAAMVAAAAAGRRRSVSDSGAPPPPNSIHSSPMFGGGSGRSPSGLRLRSSSEDLGGRPYACSADTLPAVCEDPDALLLGSAPTLPLLLASPPPGPPGSPMRESETWSESSDT